GSNAMGTETLRFAQGDIPVLPVLVVKNHHRVPTTGSDDAEFLPYLLKHAQRLRQFLAGVQGGDDGAHAAPVGGDGGEYDALGKDALVEEAPAEAHGQRALAD